jgi:hypothetical protein
MLLACAGALQAQSSIGGTWRAGATAIEVAVESWGGDCGPQPTSTRSNGGGLVTVEQKDQVLLLHGRDQDIRSDSCWSRNPAMKRTTSSFVDGAWTTRCRTSDNDPRAEQGTYSLKLTGGDTLQYRDISRYDWALNDSKCVATFTTTQTLSRAQNGKTASKPAPAAPAPPPKRVETPDPPSAAAVADEPACKPGAPARITLRPKRADIEVGQRVCFRARVSDAADCVIPSATVTWDLTHSKALRGTLNAGCFTAADTVAEAQGEFRVIAKLRDLKAEAPVVVRPIDMSALLAKRLEGGLTGFDETAPIAKATPKAIARISTQASSEPESSSSRWGVYGLGALAILLTALGLSINRRARTAARSGSVSESGEPESDREETDTSEPSSVDVATAPSAASVSADGAAEQLICPVCRIGYGAPQTFCPKDFATLITYAEFAQRGRRQDAEHAKRCPSCGKTFPASASFCGSDGTALVDA